jgi:BCD family chlorophyll transporter-like MFS transporter
MNDVVHSSVTGESTSAASWLDIARVGVVQACMGAVVVTVTTTLNRVMVIELALPALLPGFLVSLHYLIQMIRPRLGYGADQAKRFTPWILGGMTILALGGVLAALATVWMASHLALGVVSALLGFGLIGMGVSACGTPLLVLLSKSVANHQRATAATAVWIMMIFGFALTSIVSGKFLDPFSFDRLLSVSVGVSILALCLSSFSMWGLEERLLKQGGYSLKGVDTAHADQASLSKESDHEASLESTAKANSNNFKTSLRLLWRDDQARLFTYFVFTSMLAYSAQDLILEPFAGVVYHFTPGQTTQLSGTLHASVLMGMLLLAFIGSAWVRGRLGKISTWMMTGCILSALGMLALCWSGFIASDAHLIPLSPLLFVLGLGNGLFSIAAISTMMRLSTQTQHSPEDDPHAVKPGLKMGLWGAAQAVAFGLGGLLGTAASDLALRVMTSAAGAYAMVFALEASVFLTAAFIAWRVKKFNHGEEGQVGYPDGSGESPTHLTLNAI